MHPNTCQCALLYAKALLPSKRSHRVSFSPSTLELHAAPHENLLCYAVHVKQRAYCLASRTT